jgi:hypothetical protein
LIGLGRVGLLVVLCLCLALPASTTLATHRGNVTLETVQARPAPDQLAANYGNLPFRFEANQGQADSQVDFIAHSGSFTAFLTAGEAELVASGRATASTRPDSMRLRLQGADPDAVAVGVDKLPGTTNYLVGSDPERWRTGIPSFERVRYGDVYPGIDVVYYSGAHGHLECDYVLAPGADPGTIQLDFPGVQSTDLSAEGDLVLGTARGEVHLEPPIAYQTIDGVRKAISARYVWTDAERVAFEIGTYDHGRELVIDPVVVFATLLGGSGVSDIPTGLALDTAGNVYVTGSTDSVDFPTTVGAFQHMSPEARSGASNVFVSKLNPSGTGLVYSTYLGGTSEDLGGGLAIDGSGRVYVSGLTASGDFPTTPGAFQRSSGRDLGSTGGAACGHPFDNAPCFDVFATKLNPTGTALEYSTLIGPTFFGEGIPPDLPQIAVDSTGHAYVAGSTPSEKFPTTPDAFQPSSGGGLCGPEFDPLLCYDAFVTKLNLTGSGLMYSSYLGGSNHDFGRGIAVDATGSAYVVGSSQSANFPTTAGALRRQLGSRDAFVTRVNPAGTALVYSTLVGGPGFDTGTNIAIDGTGSAYIAGLTGTDFPTTPGVFQQRPPAQPVNVFVSKLNPAGSALAYSTYVGSGAPAGLTVDTAGHAFLTGATEADLPTTPGANRSGQAFLVQLNATASGTVYSTRLGGDAGLGVAVDRSGNAYVSGSTRAGFVTTPGAFQQTLRGLSDAFVIKVAAGPPACEIVALVPGPPAQVQVALHADRGLDRLLITQSTNVTVGLPSFTRGSIDTLLVTATKVDESEKAILALRATDVTGRSTTCGSVIATVGRGAGVQPVQIMRDMPAAESHVTIINATPGVGRIWLVVNSKLFKMTDLQDGETRTLDVASAMRAGSNNTIRVITLGLNGGSATVFVSDSV